MADTSSSRGENTICWCHICGKEVLGVPDEATGEMKCCECGSNFVEMLEENSDDHPASFAQSAATPSTTATAAPLPGAGNSGASPASFPFPAGGPRVVMAGGGGGGGGGGGDLASLVGNVLQRVFSGGGMGGLSLGDLGSLGSGEQGGSNVLGDYALGNIESLVAQLMQNDQNRYGPPPAADDVMDQLERYTLDEGHEDIGLECPVMKTDFEVGDEVIRLPCGHKFSPDGIEHWLKEHNNCPVCRLELPSNDEEYNRNKGLSWEKMATIAKETKKEEAEEAAAAAIEPSASSPAATTTSSDTLAAAGETEDASHDQ